MNRPLVEGMQEALDEFEILYASKGCTCFLGAPPCSYCTHPGNPICLESDDCWEDVNEHL